MYHQLFQTLILLCLQLDLGLKQFLLLLQQQAGGRAAVYCAVPMPG